ncbi:MAG: PorP/SprF family type IX secretion system membrane protein [Bacteroidales bacterium]|nr:PorP/SprF family type IX secretion system membrane protein [Bacteroidales bacterium]
MKKRVLIISEIILLSLITYVISAQDIHFSQFFSSPLYTNPANTGNFEGDFRGVLNNKNQWNTFTNAYTTIAGSFDAGFNNLFIPGSRSGLGVQVFNDLAGDGKLGTTQFCADLAYYFPFGEEKNVLLGVGVMAGYIMHNINFNNFNFGNQYSGEQFNPFLPIGEEWLYDKCSYFDLGTGINILYKPKKEFILQSGFSVAHLNEPVKSFFDNADSYLPIKYSLVISLEYNIKDDLWIEPSFLAMFQNKYSEYDIGAMLRFDYNPVSLQSIYFGTFMRTADAGIIVFGFKYHNARILINYDINLSKLTSISRGKGGVEFSLIYIFMKTKPFDSPYYRKCPDFI